MTIRSSKLAGRTVISAVFVSAVACGAQGEPDASESALSEVDWSQTRDARQAELDAYVAAHRAEYEAFMYGGFGSVGAPYLMWRLFPELFPEAFGSDWSKVGMPSPPDQGHLLPLGLGVHPSDTLPLPTGGGFVRLNIVTPTCATCHVGRVVGPDGRERVLIGAPNTTSRGLFGALAKAVSSPNYDAKLFRAAVDAKPPGFFYGEPLTDQEKGERQIFTLPGMTEYILHAFKKAVLDGATHIDGVAREHTYRNDDPDRIFGMPGSNDAFTFIAQQLVKADTSVVEARAIMPPAPAPSDIMSVFRTGGAPANWDGSNRSGIHRSLGASVPIEGDPSKVDLKVAAAASRFVDGLPPTPYPFAVDDALAARGASLYRRHCQSCHERPDVAFAPEHTGTDPNRAQVTTPAVVSGVQSMLKLACKEEKGACPDVPDEDILRATGKYRATVLHGVWSRAPYLHNGSVPTLDHLLVPQARPAKFERGNTAYDEKMVGFAWSAATRDSATYDTRLSGNSNRGHESPEYLGIDWGSHPDELAALLEYLKTL